MKYPITEGKTYKIVGATDGTVTDASGNVIVSYTAGEEVTFDAPAGDYVNINPSGNILSNYATISYVDEAIAAGGGGSFDMEAYNAFYGKYYNCTTVNEVSAINSDYKNDLTIWGEWVYKLPSLTDGYDMFRECSNLRLFSGDLSSLTNGLQMFYNCTKLRSWNIDLSKLTNGNNMFYNCTNLASWNTPLPNLTRGNNMFMNCTNLASWNTPLPKMTSGDQMFYNCTNLSSFSVDISTNIYGNNMFGGCTNLRSFTSDLPNLIYGTNMFRNCKLDAASVERILSTIPTYTDGSIHRLDIFFSSEAAAKFEEITGVTPTTSEQAVSYKGWTINAKING